MSPGAPNPPPPDVVLGRLRKVLELERARGFNDSAVMGGLDRFLRNWAAQARQAVREPAFHAGLQELGLDTSDYARGTPARRAQWVERVLRWAGTAGLAPAAGPSQERGPGAPRPAGVREAAPAMMPPRPARALLRPGQGLETPLQELTGVGPFLASRFQRLGVATVRELLYLFPRRHIDFTRHVPIRELEPGRDQTVMGTVWEASEMRVGAARRGAAQAVVGDETGNVRVIWFNQPYIARGLRSGMRIALSGRVSLYRGRLTFENPEYEVMEGQELVHTARLVPVYPLTEGLTPRRVRGLVRRVVEEAAGLLAEPVPDDIRRRRGLVDLERAVRQAHFPESEEASEAARQRLAFDELLLLQLGVLQRKRDWQRGAPGHPLRADPALLDAYAAVLPFPLTGAQRRCIQEITADLGRSTPMSRLLQGEVGSGKTAVALAAMLVAVANGHQAAFMAPTEILAEQHLRTLRRLLAGAAKAGHADEVLEASLPGLPRPVTVALITGGLARKRKQQAQELTARGEIDILIGTHALFQKEVAFASLGLAVVDEQHRFGVMQRTELRQKGYNPHLLVMTATPIPRTLSLTLYGDLDLSVIDELPPGRRQVRTRWLDASRRETACAFVRKQVAEGRQAFFIYPLIEESDRMEAAAARAEYERLARDVFPDLRVGLLHGRMKSAEKDRVMREFQAGDLDILVSTAVVEVGIDVPNATVMVVESADRFGLAQLHQFRGRVGRGQHESYCILITETPTPQATERLRLMEEVHDGFHLAEEDLRLRGPGEFFGTRQSGMPDLRMARLSDVALLEAARAEAEALFASDPALERSEHGALREAAERAWRGRTLAPGEA